MPDEQSNLNSPRRPAGGSRRRGRRGGRGRGRVARAAAPSTEPPVAGEMPPAPEPVESAGEIAAPAEAQEPAAHAEHEAESSGGFREPHPETPEGFHAPEEHAPPVEMHDPEPVAEFAPPPPPPPPPREWREPRRDYRRDERPPQPPPRVPPAQRQWTRPVDFRPAETSAIHEAVAHATFIANALKELHDQLDEVLELIEVAERQKIADEREIEELRRALRRIQPQRQPPPPHHLPHYQQQRHQPQPRREESRPPRPPQPPRQQTEKHEEPPHPPAPSVEEGHTPQTD